MALEVNSLKAAVVLIGPFGLPLSASALAAAAAAAALAPEAIA